MRRNHGLLTLGIVVVLCGSGCALAPPPLGAQPDGPDTQPVVSQPLPDLSLYGDSLTVPAVDAVDDVLTSVARLTVHAYPGTDLPTWVDDIRASAPSRLVLALGTNDANHDGAAPWRALLTDLPSSTCVVWPRPFTSSDRVAAFVRDMDELVPQFPNVQVVDWGSQVEAHRDWLLPDGIHYGPDGTAAYASMLVAAAELCLT